MVLDAMGYLHAKLIQRGARLSGYWPTQGYEFEASQALTPAVTPLWGWPWMTKHNLS